MKNWIVQNKHAQLRQLFPEACNKNGINFDHLKPALGKWVEPDRERFGLISVGKAALASHKIVVH